MKKFDKFIYEVSRLTGTITAHKGRLANNKTTFVRYNESGTKIVVPGYKALGYFASYPEAYNAMCDYLFTRRYNITTRLNEIDSKIAKVMSEYSEWRKRNEPT